MIVQEDEDSMDSTTDKEETLDMVGEKGATAEIHQSCNGERTGEYNNRNGGKHQKERNTRNEIHGWTNKGDAALIHNNQSEWRPSVAHSLEEVAQRQAAR